MAEPSVVAPSSSSPPPTKFNTDMEKIDEANAVASIKVKKLPKGWRVANLIYQILLLIMTFVNALLLVVDEVSDENKIPKLYFAIYATGISLLPVVWSKILDYAKEFHEEPPPATSSAAPSSSSS